MCGAHRKEGRKEGWQLSPRQMICKVGGIKRSLYPSVRPAIDIRLTVRAKVNPLWAGPTCLPVIAAGRKLVIGRLTVKEFFPPLAAV